MQWWPDRGLWRHPDFLRLWAAQVASAFGSRITRTALPMVAILTLRASPTEVAILSALGVAPAVVVGLVVGGMVDRSRKRPLLIGADLLRAALVLTIPLAAWLGVLSMPQLYVVAAAVGAAMTLFQIADNTLLPTLIGKEHLLEGNTKLEATEAVAEAAGPGLAGVLVQVLTAPVAVAVDGLTYLWSAWLLSGITVQEEPAAEPDATVLGDLWIGTRACLADPLVRPALLADAVMTFFGGFFLALYLVVGLDALQLSPAAVGGVIGVGGLGALLGTRLAEPVARRFGTGPAMVGCLALGLGANLLIPLSLSAGGAAVPVLILHQLTGDALLGAYVIQALALRQRVVPDGVLGRANATFHVTTGLMLPAGALVAGVLADALGLPATLWIAAGGALLAVPVLAGSPLARLR